MKSNILVTPSYAPDFERCKKMVESCSEWVSSFDEHLILVDRDDMSLFKPLQNSNVRVLCKNDFLSDKLYQIPLQKRWWISNCSLPVRGWILQQVIKIAVAKASSSDAVVFADSDLVFIRPLDLNELWHKDRLRLYRSERGPNQYQDRRYQNWYGFAAKALDLGDAQAQSGAYITQLATMRPDTVRLLCTYLENRYQKPWQQLLLNTWDFSEYVLYGLLVEKLGPGYSGHYLDSSQLCHSSWFYDIETKKDLDQFVSKVGPNHRAIHLQSNLGLRPEALSQALTTG